MGDPYHHDYYHSQERLFPNLDHNFPTPAAWPSSLPPPSEHSPPREQAPTPSSLPHTSTTRNYSTALGRQGPYECWKKKKDGTPCRQTFKLSKDLTRHHKTIHPSGDDKPFVCCCGKDDYRLDNHKRHVISCKGKTGSFVCSQGHKYGSKKGYLQHLQDGCRQL